MEKELIEQSSSAWIFRTRHNLRHYLPFDLVRLPVVNTSLARISIPLRVRYEDATEESEAADLGAERRLSCCSHTHLERVL